MVILKYVCETFSRATIGGLLVCFISAFSEKVSPEEKFGIVIPVRTDILPKPKNDERYP